jgi:hypothetical protein
LLAGLRRDGGILLLVAAALLLTWRTTAAPPPRHRAAHPAEFSLDRALGHVAMIARAPHPTGSAELVHVRRYILNQLAALHVPAETLTTTAVGTRYAVAGTVTNILARLPGRAGTGGAVLLVAHYDGVAAGPAAADDGSGVAILLETLRALQGGAPLAHDVLALFTDGEEAGLLGAAAFATQDARARSVGIMVNLEARGSGGRSLMFETSPGDLNLVRAFARVVPDATGTSFLATIYRLLPNDTDLSELARMGVPGLNFAFVGRVLTYHTPSDNPAHLDAASLDHQGRAALALARSFGTSGPPARTSRDATFFNLPLVGMIVYPTSWGRPLAALAAVALLLAIIPGMARRRFRLREPATGIAGLLAVLVVTVVMSLLVWLGVTRFHTTRPDGGYPEWSGLYLGALTLLAAGTTTLGARVARRWAAPTGMTVGVLPAWVAAAIAATMLLPGAGYVFAWPALLGAVAIGIDVAAPGRRATHLASRAAGIAAGGLALVFSTQIVALVFQGLGIGLPSIGAIAALELLVLWPLAAWLPGLGTGYWWTFPSACGVGFAALLALGLVTVRNDARRPRRDLVMYALDAGTHTAHWYASASDRYTRQFVGVAPALVQPSAVERLALGLLAAPAGVRSAPAPALDLEAPRVQVVADTTRLDAGGRTLVVRIVPSRAGTDLLIRTAGATVRTASVNGQTITTAWRRRQTRDWHLTYANAEGTGIVLRLELASTAPVPFAVAERRDGLPALPGRTLQPRPPGIESIQVPDATVVFRDLVL